MNFFFSSAMVATLLFLFLPFALLGDDTKLPLSLRNLRPPTNSIGRASSRKRRPAIRRF